MRSPRRPALALAAVLSLVPATPALAQPLDTPSDDRGVVMLVTFIVALTALGLASVGFLYRRVKGLVRPSEEPSSGHH